MTSGNEMFRRTRRVHFVGIGGIGMCGLAELLHLQGVAVSGSDLQEGTTVERLRSLGFAFVAATRHALHVLAAAVGVDGERAVIVRDVFRHRPPYGEGWTPRALAVGLPDGQHVLYDVDGLAPRAWWAGEFASEFDMSAVEVEQSDWDSMLEFTAQEGGRKEGKEKKEKKRKGAIVFRAVP